jgi:hypothetical protein
VNHTPPSDRRTRLWKRVRGTFYAPMTAGARRAFITLLVISFALAGMNLLFTARQVHAARAASASVVQLCQLGNESRAQQVSLWEHLVTISKPPPHETAAQRRRRLANTRAFLAYVRAVFRPRDCAARFSG